MNRLKQLRKERKITLRELADQVKISYPSISRFENGSAGFNGQYLIAIAEYFNVSIDYLLGRDELLYSTNQEFGKRIKKFRLKFNLTQKELAKEINKAESTIGMWEQGRREPDNESLVLLSRIFNTTIDYLVSGSVFNDSVILSEIDRELLNELKDLTEKEQQFVLETIKLYKKQFKE